MNQPAAQDSSRDRPSFRNLLSIALDALRMSPPDYIRSILGPYQTWLPPHDHFSEFTMLDLWHLRRTLTYLVDVSLPSIPVAPPALLATLLPPVVKDHVFVQTRVLHRPDYYGDDTSYPDEKWFFINGILTNGDVAQLNAAYLSYLFHRPVTLIQNGTDGAFLDLWECALEKEWSAHPSNTQPARIAFPALYDALKDHRKKRVVVICHSQGTIIMAVLLGALSALEPKLRLAEGEPLPIDLDDLAINPSDFEALKPEEWAKLEIYCFATCCNTMRYHYDCLADGHGAPWIEHFGNENDLVARLGMLAPRGEDQGIHIDGPFYERYGAWGHLLNIDYLLPIEKHQKRGHRKGGTDTRAAPYELANEDKYPKTPRLYGYINGGTPEPRKVWEVEEVREPEPEKTSPVTSAE